MSDPVLLLAVAPVCALLGWLAFLIYSYALVNLTGDAKSLESSAIAIRAYRRLPLDWRTPQARALPPAPPEPSPDAATSEEAT